MVILLMGVAGAGKTTVGRRLAESLGWTFVDGDDLHPSANVDKLRAGVPLSDADRAPWLAYLRQMIADWVARGEPVVLACSALKEEYRRVLLDGHEPSVSLVYLKASQECIRTRLETRHDHFMSNTLLSNQFETLEDPTEALVVEVEADNAVEAIIHMIRTRLNL